MNISFSQAISSSLTGLGLSLVKTATFLGVGRFAEAAVPVPIQPPVETVTACACPGLLEDCYNDGNCRGAGPRTSVTLALAGSMDAQMS